MEKTLGQIYHDAQWPQYDYENADKWCNEREAAGIAAVARHVFGEMLAAHVAECHKPADTAAKLAAIPAIAEAAKQDMEREQAEAGDWAMEAARSVYGFGNHTEPARIIREAAERQYGEKIRELNDLIKKANALLVAAIQERDALRESSTVEHAKRLADRLDEAAQRAEAAESELAELRAACEWCVTTGCSPSTGKDGRWRSVFLPNDGIEAASMVDAILAAYRNTKAASAAEGAVK